MRSTTSARKLSARKILARKDRPASTSGPLTPAPSELLGRVLINSARRFCPGELNSPPKASSFRQLTAREPLLRQPTSGIVGCCALAASGHACRAAEKRNKVSSPHVTQSSKRPQSYHTALCGRVKGIIFR